MCMLSLCSDAKTFKYLAISNRKGNMSILSLRSEVKKKEEKVIYYIYFRTFCPTDGPEMISFVDVRQTESTLVQGACSQAQSTGDSIPEYDGIHQEFVSSFSLIFHMCSFRMWSFQIFLILPITQNICIYLQACRTPPESSFRCNSR